MKNRVVFVTVVAIAVLAIIFIARSCSHGRTVSKTISVVKGGKQKAAVPAAQAKKVFSKGMGGITVQVKSSNDKPQYLRVKAFSIDGKDSSVFVTAFGTARMQELAPGAYDIEVETNPTKIYKNIKISEGKETIEDLGTITGSLNVKAMNSKGKEALLPVRITRSKSNLMVTTITANRPTDIVPGVYDLDIQTLPRQIKNDVRIESGKETVLDMGTVSGSVTAKAVDEKGTEARVGVQIKNPANNEIIFTTVTNRPTEIAPGTYDIEIMSTPVQTKKGVKVSAGGETAVEFSVKAPPQPPSTPSKKRQ